MKLSEFNEKYGRNWIKAIDVIKSMPKNKNLELE